MTATKTRSPLSSRAIVSSLVRLLAGAVLFALLIMWYGPELAQQLREVRVDWPFAILTLFLVLCGSVVTTWRWQYAAKHLAGEQHPFLVCLRAFLLSRILGYFVSALAMDIVGRRLGLGVQGRQSSNLGIAGQVLVERWFDMVLPAVTLLLPWLAQQSPIHGFSLLAIVTVVGVVLGALTINPLIYLVVVVIRKIKPSKASIAPVQLDRQAVLALATFSFLRWLAITSQSLTLCYAVGVDVGAVDLTLGTAASQVAAIAALTPGGLGIQDAGWLLGLQGAAVPASQAALITVVQRLGIMLCFALLASVAWFIKPLRH